LDSGLSGIVKIADLYVAFITEQIRCRVHHELSFVAYLRLPSSCPPPLPPRPPNHQAFAAGVPGFSFAPSRGGCSDLLRRPSAPSDSEESIFENSPRLFSFPARGLTNTWQANVLRSGRRKSLTSPFGVPLPRVPMESTF
jgi:hypothetical protein